MFYKVLRNLLVIYLAIFNHWKIKGKENIPAEGSVVLISNHVSLWDPVVFACSVNRTVHFMAKEELFKIFFIGSVLKKLDMIPVRRGESDRKAVKESLDYLKSGEILALFPEGTRNKKREGLLPFHTGAAFFAKSADLEVLPVAIMGTDGIKASFSNNVFFKVGKPMKIKDYYDGKISSKELEGFTEILKNEISNLLCIKNENNIGE